ncbi:DUF3710 domain-containing protein [Nocardiopsis sp. RSe5-2]|uniref:DUF3710 domain-containing protein n=1 Tax=Nocardiopsis endophytica TaxID=3018445 RepID=A0ABT4U945_9ACTN|nr:DUF3710 domain-containing protein [Nocardiopsis endophytica]MDA2813473.1 DUF3710 domain-containing protein [Nocardiopsis endophytica]
MFGRRKKSEKTGADAVEESPAGAAPADEPEKEADRHRVLGPWDPSEDVPEYPRVDLGCLRVPVGDRTQIRFDMTPENRIIGVSLIDGPSMVQVQAFAAPKTSGLWDEMREELVEQITKQGGRVDPFDGAFGPELRAVVPVQGKKDEEGRQLGQPMRFIGVDGPRWVLRGVIRGEGAVKPEVMAKVEEVFQKIVVVRGDDPVPPREMLKITVPKEIQEQIKAQQAKRAEQAAGAGTRPAQAEAPDPADGGAAADETARKA